MTRSFFTTGNNDIIEWDYKKPDISDNQIEVQNAMTGVCSSDIAMYKGDFQLLPKEIQGHEGLGIVTNVGKDIKDVVVGDYVATRGEPAFADMYNATVGTYVKVPELHPKYIAESVACAINIAETLLDEIASRPKGDTLILGSGWLAMIVYQHLCIKCSSETYVVIGNANAEYWDKQHNVARFESQVVLDGKFNHMFDYVIDLSDKGAYFDLQIYEPEAIVVIAAEKSNKIVTNFANHLWNASTILFPSPRNSRFIDCMKTAVNYIEDGYIETESMWTHKYSTSQIEQAFAEGALPYTERPNGYKRGYISWI